MEIQIGGMNVMIGMPLYGDPKKKTTISLLKTATMCANAGIGLSYSLPSSFITFARDAALDDFLKSGVDKLFWVDGDMVWQPEDFARMLALSTQVDVVCATYPQKVAGPGNTYIVNHGTKPEIHPLGLVEIIGTGLGFSIWSRKVCEALAASKPEVHDHIDGSRRKAVFSIEARNGEVRSEDINAFEDIRALGFKVWLDPNISLGHIGQTQWNGAPGMERFLCN